MNKKIMCFIYYNKEKYRILAENAASSFATYHPEVDLYFLKPKDLNRYESLKITTNPGILKYCLAHEIAKSNKYNKIIILGADTITLSRLDEFLDNDKDILASLDYFYPLRQKHLEIPEHLHCNADVVCFNNLQALSDIIEASHKYSTSEYSINGNKYHEQAGLNEIMQNGKYSYIIVDSLEKDVHYNVMAKSKDQTKFVSGGDRRLRDFYVKDNKILTPEGKHIKVWHYCEGFFNRSEQDVKKRIEEFNSSFSQEVRQFMAEKCKIKI